MRAGGQVAKDGIQVRFWGVRGSIACPGDSYVRYGGNTACVEMRCGPHLLIFDGGTGLRELGRTLEGAPPLDADIFFSHSHLDHVAGVPFFNMLITLLAVARAPPASCVAPFKSE